MNNIWKKLMAKMDENGFVPLGNEAEIARKWMRRFAKVGVCLFALYIVLYAFSAITYNTRSEAESMNRFQVISASPYLAFDRKTAQLCLTYRLPSHEVKAYPETLPVCKDIE